MAVFGGLGPDVAGILRPSHGQPSQGTGLGSHAGCWVNMLVMIEAASASAH